MATSQRVQFTVLSGQPVTVEVTALDGKKHAVRVGIVIFDVFDTGDKDPNTGEPIFQLKAGLAIDPLKQNQEPQK